LTDSLVFSPQQYQGPSPKYADQATVESIVKQLGALFANDERVAAYSISDANNGPYGDLTPNQAGQSLSQTGKSYLASVEQATGKNQRRGLVPIRR
jgi:hypothetical protein